MKRDYSALQTTPFILSLCVLLLNDFLLKGMIGNFLTGKLSDFAGLLAFGIFWLTFFPRHKKTVLFICALWFIFWKSPLSEQLIWAWNNIGIYTIQRVVDYTDLFALVMLPLAFYSFEKRERLHQIRLNPLIPIFAASFAFMATSYVGSVKFQEEWEFEYSKETLLQNINRILETENITYRYSFRIENSNDFKTQGNDTTFYYTSGHIDYYDTLYTYKKQNPFSDKTVRTGIDTIIHRRIPIRDTVYVKSDGMVNLYLNISDFKEKLDDIHYCSRLHTQMTISGEGEKSKIKLLQIGHYNCLYGRKISEEEKKAYLLKAFETQFIDKIRNL
jgi:hypothetical protein